MNVARMRETHVTTQPNERYEISSADAWRNLIGNMWTRWSDGADPGDPETAHARIRAGIVLPHVEPKFRLRGDDVFFCIGSCFARNIEEHLMYRRLPVLSRSVPFGDRRARPNSFVNKYTPASILNELRWSLDGIPFPDSSLVEDDGMWRDLHLHASVPPAPLEAVRERRAQVRAYFERVREATVVVVTLGLVETWEDAEAGVMLNTPPSLWTARRFPGRFRLVVTDYAQNLAVLREIYDIVNRAAPSGVRIVVTVSPVPMSETFTGKDVTVANTYSKSTLRAAAEDSARGYDNVDYFPSYEAVTVSDRARTYNAGDDLHVLNSAVEAIATRFLEAYGAGGAAPHPEFVEIDYLYANPDVHEAVLDQRFTSGYEHWLAHGRAEGRRLRAESRPVEIERLVGP
jgi:GSCFA family